LASIGSVGDSHDNVLAESVVGLFKTEPSETLQMAEPTIH
jgi:hypothetical protein